MVVKELKVRYKSSFLGYLWALANPLALTLVYYITFRLILRVQVENFGVYLVTGIFPWMWMSNTLIQSTGAYRNNETLIRKVKLERPILPLSSAVQEMLHFFFAFPVVIGALTLSTGVFRPSWFLLAPVMALIQLCMIFPIGVTLAIFNVFVRDIEYIIGIALQMLFFLTPIVYPQSGIPERYRAFFEWNPFYYMVSSWRSVFYTGALDLGVVARCLVVAVIAGVIAVVVHRRLDRRIGEYL